MIDIREDSSLLIRSWKSVAGSRARTFREEACCVVFRGPNDPTAVTNSDLRLASKMQYLLVLRSTVLTVPGGRRRIHRINIVRDKSCSTARHKTKLALVQCPTPLTKHFKRTAPRFFHSSESTPSEIRNYIQPQFPPDPSYTGLFATPTRAPPSPPKIKKKT